MKVEIKSDKQNLKWEVSDDKLNVLKPLLDCLGEIEEPEESFIRKFKNFAEKYNKKQEIRKIKEEEPEDETPLGIGAKCV